MEKLKEIFINDSDLIPFIVSVAFMWLGYGVYKGILDNYLAEIVVMNEFDRGLEMFLKASLKK